MAACASVTAFFGVGSNVEPERHLRLACKELRRRFGDIECSATYRNPPVGFEGDDFLNLVVRAEVSANPAALIEHLEEIHALAGRERASERFGPRQLDIDLLLYGDVVSKVWKLPRKDLVRYAFVAQPMAELAPDLEHPEDGRRMAEIWQQMRARAASMERVAITL